MNLFQTQSIRRTRILSFAGLILLTGCTLLGYDAQLTASVNYVNPNTPSVAMLVVYFEQNQLPVVRAKVQMIWHFPTEDVVHESRTDHNGMVHWAMEMPSDLAGETIRVGVIVNHQFKEYQTETAFVIR